MPVINGFANFNRAVVAGVPLTAVAAESTAPGPQQIVIDGLPASMSLNNCIGFARGFNRYLHWSHMVPDRSLWMGLSWGRTRNVVGVDASLLHTQSQRFFNNGEYGASEILQFRDYCREEGETSWRNWNKARVFLLQVKRGLIDGNFALHSSGMARYVVWDHSENCVHVTEN